MPDPTFGAEPPQFDDEPVMRGECLHPNHCYVARRDLAEMSESQDAAVTLIEGLRLQMWLATRMLAREDSKAARNAVAVLRAGLEPNATVGDAA